MEYKHDTDRGCDLKKTRTERVGFGIIDIYYCSIHKVETCRCGVEWGHHTEYYKDLKKRNAKSNLPIFNW